MKTTDEITELAENLHDNLKLELYMAMLIEIGGNIHHCETIGYERLLDSAIKARAHYIQQAIIIKESIREIFLKLHKGENDGGIEKNILSPSHNSMQKKVS